MSGEIIKSDINFDRSCIFQIPLKFYVYDTTFYYAHFFFS